jgi:hypothetical protein
MRATFDGPEEREDRVTEGLDLFGRHDVLGDAEQDYRDTVIVRRPMRAVRLNAGAQVVQRASQIAVATERQHECDAVAD